ncbi:MAG TPA: efflux RND transporter periplasmic adaptor subunit [Geminicoccus sp.]|uniref:efflux RND transporter periplasmic adaptor subunit n=1 Tax=Geminicoccus sp. TaxID=2024832 RepID=UPI002E344147|nr:efflux RND transporter periplasmic adaptor subunit [Geminicoccus sp.]HEX2529798.1 efflux RND transporter periplasmic adaptor subunit [Geminicoccus sp.]
MRNLSGRLATGLMLAGALILAGCGQEEGGQQQSEATPPTPEVTVVTLTPQPVEITTTLPGRASPYQIAEVRPQVNGILQERLFREGADVVKGEALYQIDPAVYRAAYETSKAELAQAEAALVSARNRERRNEELVRTNAVSRAAYDDAVSAMGEASAAVEARKAALASAKINLDYTTVTAPIAGRIGRSAFTAGALVTANQAETLTTIHQLDPIYVDVTQSSAELLKLRRALADGRYERVDPDRAEVELTLEDGTTYGHPGALEFADVTVSESTGAVTLRALFPNPEGILLPGMFVRAEIKAGVDPEGILVPQRAVSRDPKGRATALVVAAEDKVEQRILVTDRTVGDQWLVSEGVKAGERVIVEGLQKVRPGAVVKVIEAETKSVADASAASAPVRR